LTPRGRKAADIMAKYIKDEGLEPSVVLCTSALRARETLEILRPALPEKATIKIEPRLYSAGSKELVTRIRRLSQSASSVLLIGHNPAMQELVLTLASKRTGKLDSVVKKFPTAALAILDAKIEQWRDLEEGKASLVDVVTPKGLRS
jgi:phosphohistidine phosphatase